MILAFQNVFQKLGVPELFFECLCESTLYDLLETERL